MRSFPGDGYTLHILQNESAEVGPGLVYCYAGRWEVDGHPLTTDMCGEIIGYPVEVSGEGVLAVAQPHLGGNFVYRNLRMTPKPWGFEMDVPGEFTELLLKRILVEADHRTSLQSHVEKDEVIVALKGNGPTIYPEVGEPYTAQAIHIVPGVIHRTVGEVDLLEASTYHPTDVIRHEDDYSR